MKRTTLLTLVLTVLLVMQYGASVTYAQQGGVLLDPRDGMYLTRIINLTGEQLSITASNDATAFSNSYSSFYSTGFPTSTSNPLNNQQNLFASQPILLDTLLTHSSKKTYAFPQTSAAWEGMINLCPLIPASNEDKTYITYSGHFSQGQRLTINTVNNSSSALNGAYVQFGYDYSTKSQILWGNVFDFAASAIKDAASIAIACDDGDVKAALSSGASAIKSTVKAFQTNPVTPSLNSAAILTQQPSTTQVNEFKNQVTTNYAQAIAYFANSSGGLCLTNFSTNNQIYTLASAKQMVVTLTAADGSIRYFTAPAYYIHLKNVQAVATGDVNECTIAIVDGWIYNLAVGMSGATNIQTLQNLNPLQMMYYAGSPTPPVGPAPTINASPTVNINVSAAAANTPVTINSATISYIGG